MKLFKAFLLIFSSTFLFNIANAQKADSVVFYFKNNFSEFPEPTTKENADFMRVILPSDNAFENTLNIKEYYMNGNVKLIGKIDPQEKKPLTTGLISLTGTCSSYYSDGKKQDIAIYKNGQKDGIEYVYYTDGQTFYTKNNVFQSSWQYPLELYWDCYDLNGTATCRNGNGHFILYTEDAKNIKIEGEVKKGLRVGEWHGSTVLFDTIKYVYKFRSGNFVSGEGFDKKGKKYPFTNEVELPNYPIGNVNFVNVLRERFKIPRDANDQKMSIENLHFSFVIENDGALNDIEIVENKDTTLLNALKDALSKCKKWNPRRFCGIPIRSKMTFPLKVIEGFIDGKIYNEKIEYTEKILGF